MAIQILPPQLANQIAAGEVVERPASVVKELVENCLDAGATKVDIEIEKGGAKLIRIQDNGGGIDKADLPLALSRHATSKLHSLDDLETILSFGFRGEALASISSVSRLCLTSRTEQQSEAWMAYAEGSEMAVKIQPAAHPVGTTIEVADLFFNTPARRRFLKSDKTEFSHIDEWLKRMALVRPDIQLTLKHNGKQVRHYRPATRDDQFLQRLAQVAGRDFAEQAVQVECAHEGLHLSGYLQSPLQITAQDTHYFYVNGRLVRDRLVNHAVRQAFAELDEIEQPGYVLMLQLDPHQVDVNVHPAKLEVRFHQARYVHDFILQALTSALEQSALIKPGLSDNPYSEAPGADDAFYAPPKAAITSGDATAKMPGTRAEENPAGDAAGAWQHSGHERHEERQHPAAQRPSYTAAGAPSATALHSYGALLSTPGHVNESAQSIAPSPPLLDGAYWVVTHDADLLLLPVKAVASELQYRQIQAKLAQGLPSQPLLMPVALATQENWKQLLATHHERLQHLGFELNIRYQQLIIKKVPPYLRDTQLASLIHELLTWFEQDAQITDDALARWMATKSVQGFVSAPVVWQALHLLDDTAKTEIYKMAKALPWRDWLEQAT
ncbi:DNA mismatch repair endonuclease MutL [Shewanella sp. YIC-542]|uniref:DNA mismatch repair endonuclease MutL n=1 Tax=Shewanella mytili TaxID=3377111 RepID=UPI00398F8C93